MASTLIISFIATSLVSLASCDSLLTTQNAKGLANQLRKFDDRYVEGFLHSNNKSLTDLYNNLANTLPKEHVSHVKIGIANLNDAMSVGTSKLDSFATFHGNYIYARKIEQIFVKLASDITKEINETAKFLDENLYRKPTLFDLMAHNKDSPKNCVTVKSSIELIEVLYNKVIDFEIRKFASELYARDMKTTLRVLIDLETEDVFVVMTLRFEQRVDKVFKTASDALENARKEIEQCQKNI